MKKLLSLLLPKPIKKIIRRIFPAPQPAPANYKILSRTEFERLWKKYQNAWQNPTLPQKQLASTSQELPNFHKIKAIHSTLEFIKQTGVAQPQLLDIGCSSGYYYEIFQRAGLALQYEGCDYSKHFISLAKQRYPDARFKICSAEKLVYPDNSFDIVLHSSCLQYIPNYALAVKEAARVSRRFVIMHRLPILHRQDTTFLLKKGYGVEMLEIWFNEEKLIKAFSDNNLAVRAVKTIGSEIVQGLNEPMFMKGYLCEKV